MALSMLLMLFVGMAQDAKLKAAPPAKLTVTAQVACLHCTFGEGEQCVVCLKVDDKTPLLLTGTAAKPFEEDRLGGAVLIATGTLTRNKDKRLELACATVTKATPEVLKTAPGKGQSRVEGHACCAKCDLKKFDQCTMAVKNAALPIILSGDLADQHAGEGAEPRPVVVTGRLFLDKDGTMRIEAAKVEDVKKK